jgi:hypothetical protein
MLCGSEYQFLRNYSLLDATQLSMLQRIMSYKLVGRCNNDGQSVFTNGVVLPLTLLHPARSPDSCENRYTQRELPNELLKGKSTFM